MELLAVILLAFIFLLILVIGIVIGGLLTILKAARGIVDAITRIFNVF